jgi:S-(hydroxymethyl)glutathione dehydrogenase/alcohol dehydrogenase
MKTKMKAAVLYEAGSPLVVEEVELEGPGRDEVLVRMAACGVCHSDVHQVKGEWAGFDPPIVIGHEGAGVVEQVGDAVTTVKPGDHVVLGWQTSCWACAYCMTGQPHLCDNPPGMDPETAIRKGDQKINFSYTTAFFAEYAAVPKSVAIPIRKEMPLDRASLLACAVMTGVGAAMNTAQVRPGTTVAVFGCGGVGLNVIQGAALCGAGRIIGVDVVEDKLEYARKFGLTDAVNAAEQDPVEAIKELTDGAGADYGFEAIGNVDTMAQAFASVAKGGKAVIAGMPAFRNTAQVSLPVMHFFGDRWLTGAYYGGANLWRDIPRLVNLYLGGKLDVDSLVTRRYPLEKVNEGFADLVEGGPGRGVVVFE